MDETTKPRFHSKHLIMAGIVVFTIFFIIYYLFVSSGKKSGDSSKKSKEGIVLAQPRDDTQYIEAIAQKINRTFGYE